MEDIVPVGDTDAGVPQVSSIAAERPGRPQQPICYPSDFTYAAADSPAMRPEFRANPMVLPGIRKT